MQDEDQLFAFLRNSPKHGVVLNVIAGVIDLYHRVLPRVVAAHDLGLQQEIALIIRFLKMEACDRVSIRNEHFMLDGVERMLGIEVLDSFLERQRQTIANLHSAHLIEHQQLPTMEHLFEGAGATRAPSWGVEYGRANVGQLLGVRAMRYEVFRLTRARHKAFFTGRKQESWQLKLQADDAQKWLGVYAGIEGASKVQKMVKELYGEAQAVKVVEWVENSTRVAEYQALRDSIKAKVFAGRIYSRSTLNDSVSKHECRPPARA